MIAPVTAAILALCTHVEADRARDIAADIVAVSEAIRVEVERRVPGDVEACRRGADGGVCGA